MKKTILVSALAAAFGLSGVAYADTGGMTTDQRAYDDGVITSTANNTVTDSSTRTNTNTNTETRNDTRTNTDTKTENKTDSSSHSSANSSTNYRDTGAAEASGARSAALNNGSTGTFTNAFNVATATATSR